MFAANVQRNGHHKDYGSVGYENDEKVLIAAPPSAEEHDQRLGLAPPITDRQTGLQIAAEFLGEIATWFGQSTSIHSAGLRAYAVALVLRPDVLPDQSATGMARELGVTKQALSKYVSELVLMGEGCFHFAGLRGKADREQRRKLAIAYHRRAGHAIGPEEQRQKRRINLESREPLPANRENQRRAVLAYHRRMGHVIHVKG